MLVINAQVREITNLFSYVSYQLLMALVQVFFYQTRALRDN